MIFAIQVPLNYFLIGGDLNTDLARINIQTNTLKTFIAEENLFICDTFIDSDIPYTYSSKSNGATSTIDHFIITPNLSDSVINYKSLFMNNDFSDHVPIMLELSIDVSYHKKE